MFLYLKIIFFRKELKKNLDFLNYSHFLKKFSSEMKISNERCFPILSFKNYKKNFGFSIFSAIFSLFIIFIFQFYIYFCQIILFSKKISKKVLIKAFVSNLSISFLPFPTISILFSL